LTFCQAGVAQQCEDPAAAVVVVNAEFDRVTRDRVPASLFGFNLPWRDFQIGLFRDGRVDGDILDLLKPFAGAVYRYPGGTPSNTFVWREAVGSVGGRQPVEADYGRRARVDFGLPEFADFLAAVDGQAVLTVNLVGDEKNPQSLEWVRASGGELMKLLEQAPALACVGSQPCRLFALELGNELDNPPARLTADQYVARARAFMDGAGDSAKAKAIPWIAMGRSAPWEARASDYADFNQRVMQGLGQRVVGLAFHPYYDGINVGSALKFLDQYAEVARRTDASAKVFVTEHGRWPAVPKVGKWQTNWHQTTDVGGALATADFLLGLMERPQVQLANWHALSAAGPWQLIRKNEEGVFVPTVLYWSMRLLRESMLASAVAIDYSPSRGTYAGGYDQRIVALRSANGTHASFLGVNRADRPVTLQIKSWGKAGAVRSISLRTVSGPKLDFRNEARGTAQARIVTAQVPVGDETLVCIPARAVFALDRR